MHTFHCREEYVFCCARWSLRQCVVRGHNYMHAYAKAKRLIGMPGDTLRFLGYR